MNLNEEIRRIKEIMQVDEMAYPLAFNFEEFRAIRSFAGRLDYAKRTLLGKVGAGSGRAVFQIDNEKVLKVAMNAKGVAQNEAESDWGAQHYDIIAKVFERDPEGTWLEMELAKRVSPSRFKQLTGITLDELIHWMRHTEGIGYGKLSPEEDERMNDNEFAADVAQFVADYAYPVPGDFGAKSTYGEVLRKGKPTVVIVDFGYNSDTDAIYTGAVTKAKEGAAGKWVSPTFKKLYL
jgi:hypothetical protein